MATIDVNKTDLYYEDEGTGPTLLFVHGLGTSARVWGAQQVDLTRDHRVVAVDCRGCGRSGRPRAGNDLATAVEDLAALIEGLGLDQPVVIGSSLGAIFATELALAHPEVIGGAVLVDGASHYAAQEMDLDSLLAELRTRDVDFLVTWVRHWFAPGTPQALVDWTVTQLLDASPYIYDHLLSLSDYDPRPRLAGIPVPLHYIHGALDPEIPVSISEESAALTPGASLTVVPGSGHMPHQERPLAFNETVRDFVRRAGGR